MSLPPRFGLFTKHQGEARKATGSDCQGALALSGGFRFIEDRLGAINLLDDIANRQEAYSPAISLRGGTDLMHGFFTDGE